MLGKRRQGWAYSPKPPVGACPETHFTTYAWSLAHEKLAKKPTTTANVKKRSFGKGFLLLSESFDYSKRPKTII